jgi:transcriptional regulator with XRE-family HTH domain
MMRPARDPAEVAKRIKFLRDTKGMKAETLAELSRLSLRSIERAESGRYLPSERSLTQIAKVFGVAVTIFDPVDDEAFRRQIEESAKKTTMVATTPLENPAEVMARHCQIKLHWAKQG